MHTQIVFDVAAFVDRLDRARGEGIFEKAGIIPGAGPLKSLRMTKSMRDEPRPEAA